MLWCGMRVDVLVKEREAVSHIPLTLHSSSRNTNLPTTPNSRNTNLPTTPNSRDTNLPTTPNSRNTNVPTTPEVD
ncbi:hypothetical protein Pmani_015079 [Petrolisthes manimaculis]|uniref:Uncharacterized protein n=1 Tax=Petrolisthes manimaculis TaxID=1843537 RepID=A0AAE1PU74_9EUCA|nr:hypothetical protein Pmani_015079 [Petrolisthes manimaculis]